MSASGAAEGQLPSIGVTMGDPAGIGPEVVARALADARVLAVCRPVVFGTPEVLDAALRLVGGGCGGYAVEPVAGPRPGEFQPGVIAGPCGDVAFRSLEAAARAALAGEVAAIATAPLHKEATSLAGYADIGHLEYLTRLTGARETATVLCAGNLRCLHLTTHKSLADAVRWVTEELVLARLRLGAREMRRFGVERPRIAVAALNPHGGEGGLFGREELDELAPAVAAARAEGLDAHGPLPADSLLAGAVAGGWDLILVLYHDQGHIAVKVHDLYHSYTVAFGLPLVRTSVDHGTAFDLAWQGRADSRSMIAAIIAAAALAGGRWPRPSEVAG